MRNHIFSLSIIGVIVSLMTSLSGCGSKNTLNADGNIISFYEVPLVCGAAPEIGCGSRIKPFFIDTKKETLIKESWSNRAGTIIAIVWDSSATSESSREEIIQSLFKKNAIEATLISEDADISEHIASMKSDKWYEGMDVDLLSLEEAGVIAEDLTAFAVTKGLIDATEKEAIKKDLEAYFKKELVIVRTCDELKSQETQDKWRSDGYEIYVTHIGKERADSVDAFFEEYQILKEEKCKQDSGKSCCDPDKKDCSTEE